MKKNVSGFTIVELLIVIVVIAILAAIGVVAYTGIQSRANDTSVQADIGNFAMKVQEHYALNGAYPQGSQSGGVPEIGRLSLNHSAYLTSVRNNFYYCRAVIDGVDRFGILAVSSSGTIFGHRSDGGTLPDSNLEWRGGWGNGDICPRIGIPTTAPNYTFAYAKSVDGWFSWTQ